MSDKNVNWLDSSLSALPGVLGGVSQVIYAEKGISTAPVTYVQAPAATTSNNMLIYGVLIVVAIIALFIIFKK